MSNVHILYIGNDNLIEVDSLKNDLTGGYVDSAAVSVTLTDDASGAPVVGQTWPVAMESVAGSSGVYRATLSYALALTENQRLTATITADAGAGLRAQWALPCVARQRG